jgi:maleylpyruvate isomerase
VAPLTGLPPGENRPPWETLLSWADEGQRRTEQAAASLDPARLREPSRLTTWSRGHVLSHLARNADALTNLLTWARTGVETRMYSSPAGREEGINAGAHRGLPEQLADLTASGARFRRAADAVPAARRSFPVISGQGRQIPVCEVPWLRVREVWLHLVDLGAGYDIDVLPDAVAWALTVDVAGWMTPRTELTADLRAAGHGTVRLGSGSGPPVVIEGTPQRLAGWLTGRASPAGLASSGGVPSLPRWL